MTVHKDKAAKLRAKAADPGVTPAESRALGAKAAQFGRPARCASRGSWMYADDHPGGHLRSGHPIGDRALAV